MRARSLIIYLVRGTFSVIQAMNAVPEGQDSFSANDEYLKWQKLGKQRDPEAWEMFPSTVNAYFNPPANEVCH